MLFFVRVLEYWVMMEILLIRTSLIAYARI